MKKAAISSFVFSITMAIGLKTLNTDVSFLTVMAVGFVSHFMGYHLGKRLS